MAQSLHYYSSPSSAGRACGPWLRRYSSAGPQWPSRCIIIVPPQAPGGPVALGYAPCGAGPQWPSRCAPIIPAPSSAGRACGPWLRRYSSAVPQWPSRCAPIIPAPSGAGRAIANHLAWAKMALGYGASAPGPHCQPFGMEPKWPSRCIIIVPPQAPVGPVALGYAPCGAGPQWPSRCAPYAQRPDGRFVHHALGHKPAFCRGGGKALSISRQGFKLRRSC